MNVIIAGGREFGNYALLKEKVAKILSNVTDVTIISGMARGADLLGWRYAKEIGCGLIEMPADWNKYGKSAGYRRNEAMAAIADSAIIFWDGQSKGTSHMIDIMNRLDKPVRIIRY